MAKYRMLKGDFDVRRGMILCERCLREVGKPHELIEEGIAEEISPEEEQKIIKENKSLGGNSRWTNYSCDICSAYKS